MEPGDGRRREVKQHVVQEHDLLPVGVLPAFGFGVAGDDRRLQLVRTGALLFGGAGQLPESPLRSLSLSHSDRSWCCSSTRRPSRSKRAAARARCSRISASRPATSGSVGISPCSKDASHSASSTRSRECARSAVRQVALVEQQVDHGEDLGQAGAELVIGGDPVRDSARP